MSELDGILRDGQEYKFVDAEARQQVTERVVRPIYAKVGDYLRVTETDSNGTPIKFECASIEEKGAHSKILCDVTFDEPTASVSVTLDHSYHKLFCLFASSENCSFVDDEGNAISAKLAVLIDTLSEAWNSRELGAVNLGTNVWQSAMITMVWTDDLKFYLGPTTANAGMGPNSVQVHYGGTTALVGTFGSADAKAPVIGSVINILPDKGFFNSGVRVTLVGEYYGE